MKRLIELQKELYGFCDWPSLSEVSYIKYFSIKSSAIDGYTLIAKDPLLGLKYAYRSLYVANDSSHVGVEVIVIPFASIERSKDYLMGLLALDNMVMLRPSLEKVGVDIKGSIGYAGMSDTNEAVYSALFIYGNVFFHVRNVYRDNVDISPFLSHIKIHLDSIGKEE